MKRSILVSITPVSRGVRQKTQFMQDGFCVKTVTSTRLWPGSTSKSPDHLLLQQVAGAVNHEIRAWMDQLELPF